MKKSFADKCSFWFSKQMFLIVGLDIKQDHIPESFKPEIKDSPEARLLQFIYLIIDLTAIHCSGWKPNLKFYEGSSGRFRLEQVCEYICNRYPDHILIGDNKDGDIGNTNKEAIDYYVNILQLDAFTMNPLMGYEEGCDIYLSNPNVGVFTLCLTSNKGAVDILCHGSKETGYLFEKIADNRHKWDKNKNYHLVVGGTNSPHEIALIRSLAGNGAIFLMPGFGAQGGDYKSGINAAINSFRGGFLGVVARDIIKPKLNNKLAISKVIIT